MPVPIPFEKDGEKCVDKKKNLVKYIALNWNVHIIEMRWVNRPWFYFLHSPLESYIEFVDNSQNIYSLIIDHMLNETFNAFLDDMREQNPVCLNKIHSGMCKMLISKDFQN